jgi:hypothetical protein
MGAELLGSNLGHEKVQHHEADDAHLQTGLIAGLEIPAQSPCTVTLHSHPAQSPCTVTLHSHPAQSPCTATSSSGLKSAAW